MARAVPDHWVPNRFVQTSSLLRKYVALLTVSPTDDWAGNYVEYLLRSQTLIAPGFDIAKAFDAAEQSGAGRLLGFRPVKPIEVRESNVHRGHSIWGREHA